MRHMKPPSKRTPQELDSASRSGRLTLSRPSPTSTSSVSQARFTESGSWARPGPDSETPTFNLKFNSLASPSLSHRDAGGTQADSESKLPGETDLPPGPPGRVSELDFASDSESDSGAHHAHWHLPVSAAGPARPGGMIQVSRDSMAGSESGGRDRASATDPA